jgi:DNA-directed RNA polymerase specialized sigma24 family protein
MGDPRLQSGIHSDADLESWIHTSYSRILKCCLCAGLAPSEADDIAQDIWLWLLREGRMAREVSMPWLVSVARNFILRYRRRKYRRCTLEGYSLDACPEPRTREVLRDLEVGELLDRISSALSETERRILALIRDGHSLAESARLLGIPHGSQAYHWERLVACARRVLARRSPLPTRVTNCTKPRSTPPRKTGHWGQSLGVEKSRPGAQCL